MTRNELHVLARQAMRDTNTNGDDTLTPWMVRFVERFGRLVAEAERQGCAAIPDRNVAVCGTNTAMRDVLAGNALAIRARSEA